MENRETGMRGGQKKGIIMIPARSLSLQTTTVCEKGRRKTRPDKVAASLRDAMVDPHGLRQIGAIASTTIPIQFGTGAVVLFAKRTQIEKLSHVFAMGCKMNGRGFYETNPNETKCLPRFTGRSAEWVAQRRKDTRLLGGFASWREQSPPTSRNSDPGVEATLPNEPK